MPTNLPRLNVTVTREQHSLLLELAELQDGSASGFLRGLLDDVTPLLRHVVPVLRTAAQEKNMKEDELQRLLNLSLSEIRGAVDDAQMDIEDVLSGSRVAVPEGSSRASAGASGTVHTMPKASSK